MSYTHITTAAQLSAFCDELAQSKEIAFDTEFVSEHTYRSQLCLVQVCTPDLLAVIDPLAAGSLKRFWEVLAEPGHQTIVHAGREELLFSLNVINHRPANLFDIQIAAGLAGDEFPAGYASLVTRLLHKSMHKGETRTDWRRRPLNRQQLEYALDDVRYLIPMRDKLTQRLNELGRLSWLESEMDAFQTEIEASRTRERWWRISGISGLSPRSLAVAREIWRWREAEALRRDTPPRQVLRDDLLVELAKRRSSDVHQIRVLRGMERRELQPFLPKIAEHIQRAWICRRKNCRTRSGAKCPAKSTCSANSCRLHLQACAAQRNWPRRWSALLVTCAILWPIAWGLPTASRRRSPKDGAPTW